MKYYSPTAYKIARQKRYLKWLADNGPVYDPDKYPVPLEEMEEAGPTPIKGSNPKCKKGIP